MNTRTNIPRKLIATLLAAWCLVVGTGLAVLWAYEWSPGNSVDSPQHWPVESQLSLHNVHPTLLVFAHPKCPCTRATLYELEQMLTRCEGLVDVRIIFFTPDDFAAEYKLAHLWSLAQALPGVQAISDQNGTAARHFHATTSGQVVLYDPQGRLMFSGGITASRGHAGRNAGRTAVESILLSGRADLQRTVVFGCLLRSPDNTIMEEETQCLSP